MIKDKLTALNYFTIISETLDHTKSHKALILTRELIKRFFHKVYLKKNYEIIIKNNQEHARSKNN